jgi:hypothetical protein
LSNVYSGGITGYTVVKNSCSISNDGNYNAECTASCGNAKAIGGGGYPTSENYGVPYSNKGCGIAHNGPTDNGVGWRIGILPSSQCGSGTTNYIVAYAICATA